MFLTIFATVKAKATLMVLVAAFCISFSNIFVFRYLNKVVGLNGYILYLIILFYSLFSILYLSFTIESFTFSIYALTFILYYSV
ncbi:DUF6080 domain-containing protein [Dysgonomonas sp. GY617]|uniref:DUF6080 domain-containing protein n=1 Tax=Dysgonomonas sp. GY617 TaxID=2780420 RepID=UPI003977D83B